MQIHANPKMRTVDKSFILAGWPQCLRQCGRRQEKLKKKQQIKSETMMAGVQL